MARGSRSKTICRLFAIATLLLAFAQPSDLWAQTAWRTPCQYAAYAPHPYVARYPASPMPRLYPYVRPPQPAAWQAQQPQAVAIPIGPLAAWSAGTSVVAAPPQTQSPAAAPQIQRTRYVSRDLPLPPPMPPYRQMSPAFAVPAPPSYGLEYRETPEEHAGKQWTLWQWLTSSFHDPWPREISDPCVYAQASALRYRLRPLNVSIPLITTGDPADVPPGAIGQESTRVLLGNQDWEYGTFTGGRVRVGKWFGNGDLGIEGSGFILADRTVSGRFASDAAGSPVLAFPIYRAELGREGVFQISDPVLVLTGAVDVQASSRLWGWQGNAMVKLMRTPNAALDLLVGGRYLRLDENLRIVGDLFDPILGANDDFVDDFDTENQFYGGSIGGRFACYWGPFTFAVRGSVACGDTYQVTNVSGQTVQSIVMVPGTAEFPGGLFTAPTNIGIQSRHRFTVIPEVQTKICLEVTPSLRIYGGYDFIYWGEVVRPVDQIDRSVNQSQRAGGLLVGPARPAQMLRDTYFWAHGANWGFELLF